jgi:hypothetical protein
LSRLVAAGVCTGQKLTPCPREEEEWEEVEEEKEKEEDTWYDNQIQGREGWPSATTAPPRAQSISLTPGRVNEAKVPARELPTGARAVCMWQQQ